MAQKICDLTQHWSPLSGGVKRYLEGKMRYLESAPGYEHVLIVPAAADRLTEQGRTRVYEVRSPALPGSASYRALLDRRRLLAILDRERPDVIEAGDPYRGAWIALEAGRRLSIPVVGYYHSDLPRRLGFAGPQPRLFVELGRRGLEHYLKKLYGRMTATVVASRHTERRLREMGLERVVRIPLGVDLEAFAPSPKAGEVRQRLGLAPDDRLLLYIGRLAPEKNVPALFGMMDRLTREVHPGRRLLLLLVGDGELGAAVKRAAAQRSDSLWLPYCDDTADLTAWYSAADLFVHPGTAETFGLTVLEAQACGTPVLTVAGGGMEETLAGPPGFSPAASAAPDDLARAAAAALTAEGRGDATQRRAERRREVAERFSSRSTYSRLVALYGRLSLFGWVGSSPTAAEAAARSAGA